MLRRASLNKMLRTITNTHKQQPLLREGMTIVTSADGEVGPSLEGPAVPADDLSLVPSTQAGQLTATSVTAAKGSDTHSSILTDPALTHTESPLRTKNIKIKSTKNKREEKKTSSFLQPLRSLRVRYHCHEMRLDRPGTEPREGPSI